MPVSDRGVRLMSDHDSGVSPRDEQAETDLAASFSSNGSDPDGLTGGTDSYASGAPDDGTTFLADLAKAMQSTAAAEQARNAETTEQRRQAHVDAIRAREAIEAEDLRELAKEDVKGIDSWSDGEIKRIKLERERRIAARREQLHLRLEEHRTVVAREVEAVEAAISTYRTEVEQFFRRLEWETDPVAIARQAGTRPVFPVLELIGPDDVPAAGAEGGVASYAPAAADTAAETAAETDSEASDAVAVAEDQPVEASGDAVTSGSEEPDPSTADAAPVDPVIGAGAADSSARSVATPWRSEADAFVPKADPVIAVDASEATDADTEQAQATEAVAAETGTETETESEGTAEAEQLSDGSDETIEEAAEAMAAMPRSTSAGSWLRWPNASADKTDSGR